MKRNSHLYLVQRLRISGAEPPFTHAPSCCGQAHLFLCYTIIFCSRLTWSEHVYNVCANNTTADVHSIPDSTQCAHVLCARLTLLLFPAFYVLRQDVNSTEYESQNVLLFLIWSSLLGVLLLFLWSVSIYFILLLPWILRTPGYVSGISAVPRQNLVNPSHWHANTTPVSL